MIIIIIFSFFSDSCKHVDIIEKELLQVNGHECAFWRTKRKRKSKKIMYEQNEWDFLFHVASHHQHRQRRRQQYVQPRSINEKITRVRKK